MFANNAFARILGYQGVGEILQRSTMDLVAPHETARLKKMKDDRLAGKAVPSHYEYEGLRKDGELVWLECRASVVSWNGAPAIQSTVVDISERKKAEMTARVTEERLRLTLEASKVGVWEWDIPSGQVYVSEKWYASQARHRLVPEHAHQAHHVL